MRISDLILWIKFSQPSHQYFKEKFSMDEIKKTFLVELMEKPPELVASVWIIDRIPILFEKSVERYAVWRSALAKGLGVDPSSLIITGSSAFGISLNPYKNFKYFDESSDIDVAVISEHHFGLAWRSLRNLGSTIHGLSPAIKQSVRAHVECYIYWGTIATDRILPILPFGKEWGIALNEARNIEPTKGRVINARIYRDFDSLRAYQVNNLRTLRSQELEKGAANV